MTRRFFGELSALGAGVLFGAGLVVSGMTRPQKVLGFLDVFGRWDASLMFVMVGAIAVNWFAYRMIRGRSAPLFGSKFLVPTRRDLDAKLLIGAAVFGAGWGLGGYCPGPGLVSLPGGGAGAATFVIAMLAGMFATGRLEAAHSRRTNKPASRSADAKEPSEASRTLDDEIVLDVRTREEFGARHVPHAKNIPVQELSDRYAELGAKQRPITIYCHSGARSATAADMLKRLGFSHVRDIGAMSNWASRSSRLPISKRSAGARPRSIT